MFNAPIGLYGGNEFTLSNRGLTVARFPNKTAVINLFLGFFGQGVIYQGGIEDFECSAQLFEVFRIGRGN